MLSLLRVARGPHEDGDNRKHCQAELGKEGGQACSRGGCYWSLGVLNLWDLLQLGPSHLKPKIQLHKSVKRGL